MLFKECRREPLPPPSPFLRLAQDRKRGSLACKYSFLRILGFKGFLEFVLVGCGSAYPPENLLNQSGRYADLPLQQANPNLYSLILNLTWGSQFPSLFCPERCRRREGIGVGSYFLPTKMLKIINFMHLHYTKSLILCHILK